MKKVKTNWAYKVLDIQGIHKPQSEAIVETSVRLFDKIPNIENQIQSNVGLLVGKVQSGKTSVMISSAAVAFENGHKLVIAILSDTELLLTQNYGRIDATFSSFGDVEVFQVSKSGDFNSVSEEELKVLYEQNKKIFVCALKNKTRLGQIVEKFKGTGYENDPILIFDDEGDDISQNTASDKDKIDVNSEGEYYEKKFSATNNAIKEMNKSFKRTGYISVTATPQSNVMLQKFQHLSPSYVLVTKPGKGYCGLDYFHYEFRDKLIFVTNDNNSVNEAQGIPLDLKKAFAHFIAGCYLRSLRETNFKHSMMIHSSRLLNDHDIVFKKMKPYADSIKDGIQMKRSISIDFLEKVNLELGEITPNCKKIELDDLLNILNHLKITALNGHSEVKDIKRIQKYLPYHLFIGGDLLDRGVTIDGLAVVYIVRDTKIAQMDTLLQRARWFGYKASYIDTCKVYMTEELDEQFIDCVRNDQKMWDMLLECSENNISPMDCDFEFEMDTSIIIPTSRRKAIFDTKISNINVEQRFVMMKSSTNDNNISLINEFIKNHKFKDTKYGPLTHKKLVVSFSEISDFLSKYIFSSEDENCNFESFKSTFERLGYSPESKIDLLVMQRPDGKELRSTIRPNTHKLTGLLQGRSTNKNETDKDYYKGDRYIVENNPMIQIHMVTLKNDILLGNTVMLKKGDLTPMFAWMFPKESYAKIVVKKVNLSN